MVGGRGSCRHLDIYRDIFLGTNIYRNTFLRTKHLSKIVVFSFFCFFFLFFSFCTRVFGSFALFIALLFLRFVTWCPSSALVQSFALLRCWESVVVFVAICVPEFSCSRESPGASGFVVHACPPGQHLWVLGRFLLFLPLGGEEVQTVLEALCKEGLVAVDAVSVHHGVWVPGVWYLGWVRFFRDDWYLDQRFFLSGFPSGWIGGVCGEVCLVNSGALWV